MRTRRTSPIAVAATLDNSPAAGAAKVDYGPISHKGLKSAGAASKTLKLPLQLGLVANQSGIAQGGNALFGGSCCPARPGYDLATGWGSPLANTAAGLLGTRG